jgi:tripartite-type tricarboxylate transporter receptor subunit TctC
MLKRAVGFDETHVPYKGYGPAIPHRMSGQAHLLVNGIPDLLPAIKSGRVRALAIMADKRHPFLPEVSTMADQGHKDSVLGNCVGIVRPTGTPKPIINKMYMEVARLMKQPDVVEKVVQQGYDTAVSSPERFGKRIRVEIARFGKAVKKSGVRVD